jgi:hypothetical protein
MALYISAGRRFRRTLVIALGAAIVALVVGWAIGRQQVPSITARVRAVQQDAERAATALERLGIEYEQVLAGTDDLDTSVLQPLDELRTDLQSTMDQAPWLSAATRATLLDAVSEVRQLAVDGVPLEEFTTSTSEAATLVTQALGG